MDRSLERAEESVGAVLRRHAFWHRHADANLNDRQRKLLALLLDRFEGKLTTGKWAKIARCSSDTALRDIQALMERGILERDAGGGRSTGYRIVEG
jgi:Fic family protein